MTPRQIARVLGRRGGLRRAERLRKKEKQRIAALGGSARGVSLQMAGRIRSNFDYLTAILELRGQAPSITRMSSFEGPLPGIYPSKQ
jgi:hypothetical protein